MDKYDLRDKLVLKFISRNLSWGMLKHDVSDLTPFDGEDLDVEQIYIQELKKSDVKVHDCGLCGLHSLFLHH